MLVMTERFVDKKHLKLKKISSRSKGIKGISPLHNKIIDLIKSKIITASDLQIVFVHLEAKAKKLKERKFKKVTNKSILFFLTKLKDFMGFGSNDFTDEDVRVVTELITIYENGGNADNFFASEENCSILVDLLNRSDVENHFFEDTTDSELLTSSSSEPYGAQEFIISLEMTVPTKESTELLDNAKLKALWGLLENNYTPPLVTAEQFILNSYLLARF